MVRARAACSIPPDHAQGLFEDYEFHTDGVTFHLRVRDGCADARQGPALASALTLSTTVERFLAIFTGQARPASTELAGDRSAFDRLLAAFALPSPNRAAERAQQR